MRKPMLATLGMLAIAALALSAAAQKMAIPVGTLEGTVVDAQNRPVAHASVTIQTSDGHQPHATHTDANGHFHFARWETGQYDLRAYSDGTFSPWEKRIMIKSKKPTKITLRLPAPK
ncbi:MAG: carboxypeptidase-like regulatory domain-containing protein [Candidatus Acidiferrales bacterium]